MKSNFPAILAACALMPVLISGDAVARSPTTPNSGADPVSEPKQEGFVVNSVREKIPPLPVSYIQSVDPKFSVLIDRSHAWVFAFDDLGGRILCPRGFDVLLCDAALDTTVTMQEFGVVCCVQWEKFPNATSYSQNDIDKLKKYVESGGSLLLAGSPDSPLSKVAEAFGVRMAFGKVTGRAHVAPWLQKQGAPQEVELYQKRPLRCVMTPPEGAESAIVDEGGQTIACRFTRGAGKILCFADDGTYWDFCGQRDAAMNVPNMPLTVALFSSLLPDGAQRTAGPQGLQRSRGELWTSIGSVVVFFSEPLKNQASKLISKIPQIVDIVRNATRTNFDDTKLVVNMLSCGGGGYSGGREIGIQATGNEGNNLAVLAHEVTHSFTGPLPNIFGEGYASLVGMRTAILMGYPEIAAAEREGWRNLARSQDPTGRSLDINRSENEPMMVGACEGKLMGMIEELEQKYGADIMPRFLEVTRAIEGNNNPTIQKCLLYMSYAAGKDLGSWYRSLGIRYEPASRLSREEFQAKIRAYRAAKLAPR